MTSTLLIVDLHIRPLHRDAYLAAARTFLEQCRKENDLQDHTLHVDATDPCHLIVTLRWTDTAAMERHMKSAHLRAFTARTSDHLCEPAIYRTFDIEGEQILL